MAMVNNEQEAQDATKWFLATVILAILVTVSLYKIDHYLSTSDKETRLAHELRRLRTAQATLPSGVSDYRQLTVEGQEQLD